MEKLNYFSNFQLKEFENSVVLVLGGLGGVGRCIVKSFLEVLPIENIIIADKKIPEIAFLSDEDVVIFKKIKFFQVDLSKQKDVQFIFDNSVKINFIINAAEETREQMNPIDYERSIFQITKNFADQCKIREIDKYIELSSVLVYGTTEDKILKEYSQKNPIRERGKAKIKAENYLLQLKKEINFVIIRSAFVYGKGCLKGISPFFGLSLIHKNRNEEIKLIWDGKIKCDTIHIDDLTQAIAFVLTSPINKEILNLVDDNNTDQFTLTNEISKLYGTKVAGLGKIKSYMAQLNIDEVIEFLNEENQSQWIRLLCDSHIGDSPIDIQIYKEYISKNFSSMSNEKIKKLGFLLRFPKLCISSLMQQKRELEDLKILPKSFN